PLGHGQVPPQPSLPQAFGAQLGLHAWLFFAHPCAVGMVPGGHVQALLAEWPPLAEWPHGRASASALVSTTSASSPSGSATGRSPSASGLGYASFEEQPPTMPLTTRMCQTMRSIFMHRCGCRRLANGRASSDPLRRLAGPRNSTRGPPP